MTVARQAGKGGRHEFIVREARAGAQVRISDLAGRLGVSGETIRRDLDELCESGQLRRIYGGATLPPSAMGPAPHPGARTEKEIVRLAEAVARHVRSGQTIVLGAGARAAWLGCQIARVVPECRFVTNAVGISPAVAAGLATEVLLAPGAYDAQEGCVYGEDTVEYLDRFNPDLAVIVGGALDEGGLSDDHMAAAIVKRVMARRAARALLVAPSATRWLPALHHVCPLAQLAAIISSVSPPPAVRKACRRDNVDLLVI